MLKIKAADWHINQKRIPLEDSDEYYAYYDYQKRLCLEGCTIDGVHIPGYLYYHLNFWKTMVDFVDTNGKINDKYVNPTLRDNEWLIFNAIEQAEIEHKGLIIGGARRLGKDLLNCSKLYTEDGTIEIGNAKVGDRIYGRDGELTTILGVYPQGIRPVYKMTLQDGRELFCGLDHQWMVIEKDGRSYKEVVKNTRDLIEQGGEYWIPNNEHVQYGEKDLPIDPYTLGTQLANNTYHLKSNADTPHIPDIYKHSSPEQRFALLLGINGVRAKDDEKGITIFFKHSEKTLAEDYFEVCRGMGVSINKVCNKRSIKLNIPKIPHDKTLIKSIDYVFDDHTTCIMVDSPDHTFLTDNYTITHNSEFEASYISHGATFDKDSQNAIVGLNGDDIRLITTKLSKGLNQLPTPWQWMRVPEDWNKQVTLGVKEKNNKKYDFSYIMIRNLDGGNNEEAIAGMKPKKLIIDEAGKNSFLKSLQAAKPGFTTPFGWICSPIITFTGGDVDNYHDAKSLFENPGGMNFLEFPHASKPGKKHGLFLGGRYRLEGKVHSTLADYLGTPEKKELSKLTCMVSDDDKAAEATRKGLEEVKKLGDRMLYIKEQMYYPDVVEDIFATVRADFFNAPPIKKQMQSIEDRSFRGSHVEMYHDGIKVNYKASDKEPVDQFPVKNQDKDAPVVIYEHPVDNAPWALYVAGMDTYHKDGDTEYSDSLGSLYIFKRIYNTTTDKFQNMIVASYVARPDDKDYFNEQARLLIKYYNAYTLVENNEMSFIDYMKSKNEAIKYLAPQPQWLKTVTPYSKQNQSFGVSRSSKRVQNHLHDLYKRYLEEVIHTETAEDGTIISETLGVSRIFDKMLLEETIQYDGLINVDRLVSFELALALANDLEISAGIPSSSNTDPRLLSYHKKKKSKRRMFGATTSFFK